MINVWCFLLIAVHLVAAQQQCNGPPPFHVNPQSCCNHPKVVDDQIFMRCFSEFRQTRLQKRQVGFHQQHGPSPQNCVGECVFKTVNVLDKNGDIDVSAAQRYFTSGLASTPEWIPIVTEGFSKCATEAKTIAQSIRGPATATGDCSVTPGLTLACLHTHVITQCPANLWNDSPECSELKRFFANCPLPSRQ